MKRISTGLAVLLAIGSGAIAGCGGTPTVDDTGTPDAGPGDTGGTPDAPRADAPVITGDGNDTFATATPATLGAATGGVIATDGDLDYFSFTGTAGQWIQIVTEANPDDNPDMVDTVVTLYDSTMTQIAENDDALPRANTDSELTTRLPADGTYYVLVQEWSTWAGEPDESGATFMYELTVAALNLEAEVVNVDEEAGDTVAEAQPLSLVAAGANLFGIVVGRLEDATDVDVYSFSVPAGDPANFTVAVMPSQAIGNGSTATPAHVWITNAAGDSIIARIDPNDLDSVEPSLPEGDYNLFVEHGGAAGSNDFYVLKAFNLGDNPLEVAEVANNDVTTSEDLTFADNATGGRSGFILAHVGVGDTDYFRIVTAVAADVSIACGSRTSGSGLEDLAITLVNEDGSTELISDTETATEAPFIDGFNVAAGTYHLRLEASGQDPVVTGDWVRCGVHLAMPE